MLVSLAFFSLLFQANRLHRETSKVPKRSNTIVTNIFKTLQLLAIFNQTLHLGEKK